MTLPTSTRMIFIIETVHLAVVLPHQCSLLHLLGSFVVAVFHSFSFSKSSFVDPAVSAVRNRHRTLSQNDTSNSDNPVLLLVVLNQFTWVMSTLQSIRGSLRATIESTSNIARCTGKSDPFPFYMHHWTGWSWKYRSHFVIISYLFVGWTRAVSVGYRFSCLFRVVY